MMHKIKTIVFEGTVATDDDAHRWTTQVRHVNMEQTLSKVLDEFEVDDWIKISRLEIELGSIDLDSSEWISRLIQKLREQLTKQLQYESGVTGYVQYGGEFFVEGVSNKKHLSREQYELEILISYLKTGVLPWQVGTQLKLEKVIEDWIAHRPKEFLMRLTPFLIKRIMSARFLAIVDEEHFLKLAEESSSEQEFYLFKRAIERIEIIQQVSIKEKLLYSLQQYFISALARNVAGIHQGQSIHSTLDNITKLLMGIRTEHIIKEADEIEQIFIDGLLSSNEIISLDSETKPKKQLKGKDSEREMILADEFEETLVDEEEYDEDEKAEAKQEGIFIENAGLVLINAGFIKKYFAQFGWIKEHSFISQEARLRAISWLHWLSSNEDKPAGYRLSLNKVLCGIDPTEVVSLTFKLTEEEKEAGKELLSTIIEEWKALKNISTQSLQQSFLERNGRLVETDELWQLHVESKAYDILIEQLPWSFTITKLPWMPKPLFTQWSTRI